MENTYKGGGSGLFVDGRRIVGIFRVVGATTAIASSVITNHFRYVEGREREREYEREGEKEREREGLKNGTVVDAFTRGKGRHVITGQFGGMKDIISNQNIADIFFPLQNISHRFFSFFILFLIFIYFGLNSESPHVLFEDNSHFFVITCTTNSFI